MRCWRCLTPLIIRWGKGGTAGKAECGRCGAGYVLQASEVRGPSKSADTLAGIRKKMSVGVVILRKDGKEEEGE